MMHMHFCTIPYRTKLLHPVLSSLAIVPAADTRVCTGQEAIIAGMLCDSSCHAVSPAKGLQRTLMTLEDEQKTCHQAAVNGQQTCA